MSNTGKATADATKAFLEKFSSHQFNVLGKTGLHVSGVGFGTYRVDVSVDHHHDAMHLAIKEGVNIIDTSSNYAEGLSEELVGDVLNIQIADDNIKREDIVIVSKGGYIQGQLYITSQELKTKNETFPELVEYSQGLEHCIHPKFLESQLDESLKRLHIDCIDVYLLHNPEYYLSASKLNKAPIEEARSEYYRRIKVAFEYLESEVTAGRIQHYGVSSNTFINNKEDADFTSLSKLIEIAESISNNHHFSVIQCPLNLFETGALIEPNQNASTKMIDLAIEKNIGVLINRPLNAITRSNKLIRLTDFWPEDELSSLELQDGVNQLMAFENSWDGLNLEDSIDPQIVKDVQVLFTLGSELQQTWDTFEGYEYWKEALTQYILPRVEFGISVLTNANDFTNDQQIWFEEYLSIINDLIKELSNYYKSISSARSHRLRAILLNNLNEVDTGQTLSQLALKIYLSIEGISSVLVGMRQTNYVTDIIIELKNKHSKDIDIKWKELEINLVNAL
ncbi:hypothetical protein DID80_03075 [Candidatus Marinamargulisbacteria bacterium SCGC AAA071-K20]|nr:hypothetical protein DID80_03075 [Candidatus Marinamargulisbacteria bacterium SCGC AAA071-K20]